MATLAMRTGERTPITFPEGELQLPCSLPLSDCASWSASWEGRAFAKRQWAGSLPRQGLISAPARLATRLHKSVTQTAPIWK